MKFEEALQAHMSCQNKKQLASLKREQSKLQMRLEELGTITKKLYEFYFLYTLTVDFFCFVNFDFVDQFIEIIKVFKGEKA